MLLTSTTDKIEIVLGANVTTNQLQFVVSYNNTTSTGVTPTKNVSVTNNTTAVDLVPAPSSGNQSQLRYCSIFNSDSVASTVTIRMNYNGTTRTVFSAVLQVNEYLQYTYKTGWKSFDVNGAIKVNNNFNMMTDIRATEFFLTVGTTSNNTFATNTYCFYLGKATGPYRVVILNHVIVGTAIGGTTWAEVAIYKGRPSLGVGTTMTRLGWIDMSQTWTQASQNRWAEVPVTGLQAGDDIWAVWAINATTAPGFRIADISDPLTSGLVQTAGTVRPSTNLTITGTPVTTTPIQIYWNGI